MCIYAFVILIESLLIPSKPKAKSVVQVKTKHKLTAAVMKAVTSGI